MEQVPETGGPVYPGKAMDVFEMNERGQLQMVYSSGITLRDYFAAKAMQAMYANPKLVAESATRMGFAEEDFASCLAMGAYGMADAMLKARKA